MDPTSNHRISTQQEEEHRRGINPGSRTVSSGLERMRICLLFVLGVHISFQGSLQSLKEPSDDQLRIISLWSKVLAAYPPILFLGYLKTPKSGFKKSMQTREKDFSCILCGLPFCFPLFLHLLKYTCLELPWLPTLKSKYYHCISEVHCSSLKRLAIFHFCLKRN